MSLSRTTFVPQIARGVGLFEEPRHVGAGISVAQVGHDLAGGLSAAILEGPHVCENACYAAGLRDRPSCADKTGHRSAGRSPALSPAGRPRLLAVNACLDDAVRGVHSGKRNEANAFRRIGRRRWPRRN